MIIVYFCISIVAALLILFWLIPEYLKLMGRALAQGMLEFFNESLNSKFDIFYENQTKLKKKETKHE